MRVYVETNFILEMALDQEDHASCEEILDLADQRKLVLVLPAFSLTEASQTLERRHEARAKLVADGEVGRELRQLQRSKPFHDKTKTVRDEIEVLFNESGERAQKNLQVLNARLLSIASILPLGAAVIKKVENCPFRDIKVFDAIVLFSILADRADSSREPEQRCFLSSDGKAFDDPDIREALTAHNCKFFKRFPDAIRYIRSQVAGSSA